MSEEEVLRAGVDRAPPDLGEGISNQKKEDNKNTQVNQKSDSDEEEEIVLEENLDHLNNFLSQLCQRGVDNVPTNSLRKIKELREKWKQVLELTDESDANSSSVSKQKVQISKVVKSEKANSSDRKASKGVSREVMLKESKATPKVKRGRKRLSSSDTSNQYSSSEQSYRTDYGSPRPSRKASNRKQSNKMKKTAQYYSEDSSDDDRVDRFAKAIARLDNRKIPDPDKFDEKSGEDLRQYLERFEDYCRENFKGDKIFWVGELKRHLSGRLLEAFEATKTVSDTYGGVKAKLLEYYDEMKELRKERNRLLFKNAQYKRGESLYLFSSRLESMFRIAYPKH